MLENSREFSNVKLAQIVIDEDESSQQKSLSPSTQAGNPASVSQKSVKDLNENSSGFSSSPLSEIAVEKDVIEEEEDCFDSSIFKNLPLDDLRMEDEVIVEMRKEREQMMNQNAKGSMTSFESQVYRQQQQQNALAAYMANQMIWMNSLQQINQRNQSINFPYGTVNPIALASQLQQFKLASYCSMRNQQLQSPYTQNISSVLGKRGAVYDQLSGQQSSSNMFIIDDDEVRPFQETSTKPKKKVFIIERNVRPMKKKPVFKIIRDKPRRDRTTGNRQKTLSLIDKKTISKVLSSDKIGTSEEKTNGQLLNEMTRKINLEKPENKKIQEEKSEEDQSKKGKGNKRRGKEIEEDEDSYVIKLHLDSDDDDNEDIIDTPVGPEFQVRVRDFKKQTTTRTRKPLKLVWDPSCVEEEKVTTFYQKVESKFKKEILGEEFALKTWKEHNMKLKEVLAKLENNKVCYRNFFEMKQRMLRGRALH